jgi:hypothetical protein
MRKIMKILDGLFLLLAGLVIVAHQIIPHDHHFAESASGKADPCPYSNSRSDHSPGFPVHCHAFNDLASEKVVIIIPENIVRNNITVFNYFTEKLHYCPQLQPEIVLDFSVPLTNSDQHDLALLRAPPSLT